MNRLLTLTLPLLALTACYDFSGKHGRLGFSTNALVDGVHPWTPEEGLARGVELQVVVGELIATGKEPVKVELSAGGGATLDDATVSGDKRGWVRATADGVKDQFRFRWRTVEGMRIGPVGLPRLNETMGILAGHPSTFIIGLTDPKGRPLGYLPEDLTLSTSPTVPLSFTDRMPTLTTTEDVTIRVSGYGLSSTFHLTVVQSADIELRFHKTEHEGQCVVVASGWVEGLLLIDPGPIEWSHQDDTAPWAPCTKNLRARPLGVR